MARKVVVQLIDDLSGEEAQETVRFALDGIHHEIDLSYAHAAELRDQLEPYVAHGRRLSGGSVEPSPTSSAMVREETQRIREWAQNNGLRPNLRGRISRGVRMAYEAAQG